MFDEYGTIGGCDHSARLDHLAVSLQNDPNLEGLIAYYGPESVSGETLGIIRDYLMNSRGLAEERVKTVYAGANSDPREPRVQLWVVPHGEPAPELPRYENKIKTFNGLFDDTLAWETMPLLKVGEETGPPVPDVSTPNFIEMLKQQPDTVAYIVGFTGTEAAPGAWRRVAQQEAELLQLGGIAADRVRITYGGMDTEQVKVQRWILPADLRPPVADASSEAPPTKTLQIGTFEDFGLGDEQNERWAFKVVLDALQASAELRVCIVVRLAPEKAETEEPEAVTEETQEPEVKQQSEVKVETPSLTQSLAEATAQPDEVPEQEPADVLKVLENWKSELAVKYKIRADRLVVLFPEPREFDNNALEAWVVPAGAPLPDPNAEPVEEANEEANGRMKSVPPRGSGWVRLQFVAQSSVIR